MNKQKRNKNKILYNNRNLSMEIKNKKDFRVNKDLMRIKEDITYIYPVRLTHIEI